MFAPRQGSRLLRIGAHLKGVGAACTTLAVMAGLVPDIRRSRRYDDFYFVSNRLCKAHASVGKLPTFRPRPTAWMPGTSPGMKSREAETRQLPCFGARALSRR